MTKLFTNSLRMIDFKTTKKHYPRTNNESVLEFVFEKDPNLFLRKNKIKIFGKMTIPDTCIVDTGFAPKLFSMLSVEIDSQLVSNNRTRNEFFLADYIYKIGNYAVDYIATGFIGEGYTDIYNADWSDGINDKPQKESRLFCATTAKNTHTFDFCVIPMVGLLGQDDPLPQNTEVKLSFDRTSASIPLLSDAAQEITIELSDCYAVTEYVSSPDMRSYFDGIDNVPIRYDFEECEVYCKSVPQGETNIRFDNLRGGNIPSHMFIGLIETAALNGDFTKSSTKFSPHHVNYMNVSLSGNSVNGYPVRVEKERSTIPLTKFIDCVNQVNNVNGGQQMSSTEYMFNWLWSHCFESEESSRGWIGVDFKVDTAFTTPMTMVVWFICPTSITIDKFHQIEKQNL